MATAKSAARPQAAKTASFAYVAQPEYEWTEFEAAAAGSFVSLPNNGRTRQASITSPSDDTPAGRAVRAHELLHARFTPDVVRATQKLKKHGISDAAINLAEDIRLGQIAAGKSLYAAIDAYFDDAVVREYLHEIARTTGGGTRASLPAFNTGKAVWATLGLIPHPLVSELIDRTDVADVLLSVAASLGHVPTFQAVDLAKAQTLCNEARATLAAIEAKTYRGAKAAEAKFVDIANCIEDILRRAYDVDEAAKEPPAAGPAGAPEPDTPPKAKKEARKGSDKPDFKEPGTSPLAGVLPPAGGRRQRATEIAIAVSDVADRNERKAASARVTPSASRESVAGSGTDSGVTNGVLLADYSLETHWTGWGEMEICMAPLVRSKKVLVPRRGRAGADGVIPKHFHRWFSDREILDAKGRRPGGTLLIDGSGSMEWLAEHTARLIELCPALTVALYSSRTDIYRGVLTILARNGRACDPNFDYRTRHDHGKGNVVDGPALQWLCRQAGPRVWFCDGHVTGKGDNCSLPALYEAYRLACVGLVTRTPQIGRVIDILGGRAPQTPVSPSLVNRLAEAQGGRAEAWAVLERVQPLDRVGDVQWVAARKAQSAAA